MDFTKKERGKDMIKVPMDFNVFLISREQNKRGIRVYTAGEHHLYIKSQNLKFFGIFFLAASIVHQTTTPCSLRNYPPSVSTSTLYIM